MKRKTWDGSFVGRRGIIIECWSKILMIIFLDLDSLPQPHVFIIIPL
jgi:hypothetical protein